MTLKAIVISDTHSLHDDLTLPDGDILIHCGDWTNRGRAHEMDNFLTWFIAQPHKHKVFIAGNHELTLDDDKREYALALVHEYVDKSENVHYLENSSVTIEGIKIYGSPISPIWVNGWAFNFERGPEMAEEWEKIPDDVQLLITHGPPYGILDLVVDKPKNVGRDLHQGCEELILRVKELKQLKTHVFGHLHYNGGQTTVIDGVTFGNAAFCDDDHNPVHSPLELTL
jgi:predicted phosphodiesterase